MNIKIILTESWNLYRTKLRGLLIATGPFIVAGVILGAFTEAEIKEADAIGSALVSLISMIVGAMINLAGLAYLYKEDGLDLEITAPKVAVYLFATAYIGAAAILGMMFFVIPGIIIMAVTFMMPIYILKDSQGPIEAVASSASLVKEHVIAITLFLAGIWAVMAGISYVWSFVLDFFPAPSLLVSAVGAFLSILISLYTLPAMKIIYSELTDEHNKSMQPTPSAVPD